MQNLKSIFLDIVTEKNIIWEFEDVEIYQFGSSLSSEIPNDIDILIVYKNKSYNEILNLISLRRILRSRLEEVFGISIDIILLSNNEETQLSYLKQINYVKIF